MRRTAVIASVLGVYATFTGIIFIALAFTAAVVTGAAIQPAIASAAVVVFTAPALGVCGTMFAVCMSGSVVILTIPLKRLKADTVYADARKI